MYQKTFIPLVKGLNQGIDERVRPMDVLAKVTNGEFDKAGAVSKRHGFSSLGTGIAQGGTLGSKSVTLKGCFSNGTELCVIGDRHLYAWSPTDTLWYRRGPISPCTGREKVLFHSEKDHDQVDAAELDGWVLYVYRQVHVVDGALATGQIATFGASARSVDDVSATAPAYDGIISSDTAASKPHSVRAAYAFAEDDPRLLAFALVSTSSPATLKGYQWVITQVPQPAFFDDFSANVWVAGENIRTYDAIGLSGGNYVVAWIDATTRDIELELRDATHTVVASATILAVDPAAAPFKRVSLAEDTTNGVISVQVVRTTAGSDSMQAYALDVDDLTTTWGPTVLRVAAGTDTFESIGNACGLERSLGVVRHVYTWTVRDSNGDSLTKVETRALTGSDGSSVGTVIARHNLATRAKPFFHGGHAYVACDTTCGSHLFDTLTYNHDVRTVAVDAGALFEIDIEEASFVLAAVHDIGTAPLAAGGRYTRLGTSNNSFSPSSGEWRYMMRSVQYALFDGALAAGAQRNDGNEITLDFNKAPLACSLHGGASVIGGGFVSWYAGVRTEELGHVIMPVPWEFVQSDDANDLIAQEYTWQALWVSYDDKGVLHRSLPSFNARYTLTGGNDTMTLTVKINPATVRSGSVPVGVVWFRNDDDTGIPKRVTEAIRWTSYGAAHLSEEFEDTGQTLGPELYITSGEIEAVAPEGARIPVVAGGRLWLGDFFRRDRVQYSKPFAPGTAAETAIAPEFNEGFGYLLPNGQSVTAVGALDDKVVLFTEDQVFFIAGAGPADDGSANDFSGLTLVSSDCGCIEARSVVSYPEGMFFQGKAGIYELTRGLQVRFVGDAVSDSLASYPEITSGVLVSESTQVRFTCTTGTGGSRIGIILIYDYSLQAWTQWEPLDGNGARPSIVGACVHDGVYHFAEHDGTVWYEDATTWRDDADSWVNLTIETGWLQASAQSGWQRVRKVVPLCAYKSEHDLVINVFSDFEALPSQQHTVTAAELASYPNATVREQPELRLTRQKCQAVKIRITDNLDPTSGTGEGFTIAGIQIEWMPKRGLVKSSSVQRI